MGVRRSLTPRANSIVARTQLLRNRDQTVTSRNIPPLYNQSQEVIDEELRCCLTARARAAGRRHAGALAHPSRLGRARLAGDHPHAQVAVQGLLLILVRDRLVRL